MSEGDSSACRAALHAQAGRMQQQHLRDLFQRDPQRAQRYCLSAGGLTLDYAKQLVDDTVLEKLLAFAKARKLDQWIERLFAGARINHTENRAALHMALRASRDQCFELDGENQVPQVHRVLDAMTRFARGVRDGQLLGATGERFSDVVNIGIGGSDLGPRMVCKALAPQIDGPQPHFVANVDGYQIDTVLKRLDARRSLFVVTSKTFTTQETMANANAARQWLTAQLGEAAVAQHFAAVSTNLDAAAAFGIADDQVFGFWDWVGGRYSLWSAVGLSALIALGPARFQQLLAGARQMDQHFRETPLDENMPVLMALLAFWNRNGLQMQSQVLAPYAQALELFVPWLQQLEMESNGKSVQRDGVTAQSATTPALWGDVGTNAQHAFFQMLHQSLDRHPVDFILPVQCEHPFAEQHRLLIANCLAQSAALMQGKSAEKVRQELLDKGMRGEELEQAIPHRVFSGNRPSNTLLMQRLDATHLGALLALYEHRTFVLSVLWNLNAFDQWGVELGKQLARRLLAPGASQDASLDASTRALMRRTGLIGRG